MKIPTTHKVEGDRIVAVSPQPEALGRPLTYGVEGVQRIRYMRLIEGKTLGEIRKVYPLLTPAAISFLCTFSRAKGV